jgi:hypothetical protein
VIRPTRMRAPDTPRELEIPPVSILNTDLASHDTRWFAKVESETDPAFFHIRGSVPCAARLGRLLAFDGILGARVSDMV